jgi:xylulokinase
LYLGLDLGTSALKAVLVDDEDRSVAGVSEPLEVSRPREGWSEQDPQEWWQAALRAVDRLAAERPSEVAAVAGIGLSGQMHGAVLLDREDRVLRPAILWNDGRAGEECRELEERFPDLRRVAGNAAMPGFTAPKLLWIARYEPERFRALHRVLLPKAYLRWRLTERFVEEMSDASGTLWLDVGRRAWSAPALAATGLGPEHMPDLVEGTEASGELTADLARRWGMQRRPAVAGGAGDNAASAVGLGAVAPGSAFLSLGTSGVLFATTDRFAPDPARAVHAFCHALPGTWHQMGVILSAASALSWLARLFGQSEGDVLAALGTQPARPSAALFLPYLSGERTPHNDPEARGLFLGLSHGTDRSALAQAVLEGVAFAFCDCLDALRQAGTSIESAGLVGGGARSALWATILAAVLDIPLRQVEGAESAAAHGAARLARIATTGEAISEVCRPPRVSAIFEPDPGLVPLYRDRHRAFRSAYALTRQRRDRTGI